MSGTGKQDNQQSTKRMQQDPNEVAKEIARLLKGAESSGLLDSAEVTPEKLQQFLDDQWEQLAEKTLTDHQEYIASETRSRALDKFKQWMSEYKQDSIGEKELDIVMSSCMETSEQEVVYELFVREGLIQEKK